jgi:hypothetical protein
MYIGTKLFILLTYVISFSNGLTRPLLNVFLITLFLVLVLDYFTRHNKINKLAFLFIL